MSTDNHTDVDTGHHAASQTDAPPEVVTRYLEAADRGDAQGLAACFAPDGTVVDEGVTYRGRDEIIRWREQLDSKWEYTSKVTGSQAADGDRFLVSVLVEGNFPGGRADLTYSFTVVDGEVSALSIVE